MSKYVSGSIGSVLGRSAGLEQICRTSSIYTHEEWEIFAAKYEKDDCYLDFRLSISDMIGKKKATGRTVIRTGHTVAG